MKPTDIVRFDEKVSPHELRAFRERPLGYDSDDDDFDHDVIDINEGEQHMAASVYDYSYANVINMWQAQVENKHYSTVSGLIRLVIIISRMLY